MNRQEKKVIVIAGPNGAGKTMFAKEFLTQEAACENFVNADEIARGISPFNLERAAIPAARIMLSRMAAHFAAGDDFAIETTLSGLLYATDSVNGSGAAIG